MAVEARRKVVELRPEWGDAHFWLAEILWYTNPRVEKIWGESGTTLGSIQPNDATIREVLQELELAESYGLSENMGQEEEYLVEMINRTVPGLELAPSIVPTATVTLVSFTEMPATTPTETLLPTAAPTITLEPVASLTPGLTTQVLPATNNVLLLVALGLIAVGGVSIFLLKAKK